MASFIHALIAGVGLDPSKNYSLFTVRSTPSFPLTSPLP